MAFGLRPECQPPPLSVRRPPGRFGPCQTGALHRASSFPRLSPSLHRLAPSQHLYITVSRPNAARSTTPTTQNVSPRASILTLRHHALSSRSSRFPTLCFSCYPCFSCITIIRPPPRFCIIILALAVSRALPHVMCLSPSSPNLCAVPRTGLAKRCRSFRTPLITWCRARAFGG